MQNNSNTNSIHPLTADARKLLADRHILDAALRAGVTSYTWVTRYGDRMDGLAIRLNDEQGQCLMLPDGRPAQHWKNQDSSAKPKYLFGYPDCEEGGFKPANCILYLPPTPIGALVAASGHQLYLASGEPDMWTFQTAGIANVVSTMGEQSIGRSLVEAAIRWGVSEILHYPDRDITGQKATQKLVDLFAGSGITVRVFELPDVVNEQPIKDVNDLFCALNGDVVAFRQCLEALPILELASPVLTNEIKWVNQQPAPTMPRGRLSLTVSSLPTEFLDAIENALGVRRYHTNGWSAAVACPFCKHENDHKQPAAGWHRDMHILRCFKCGQTWLAKDVGAQLGIDWPDYVQRRYVPRMISYAMQDARVTEGDLLVVQAVEPLAPPEEADCGQTTNRGVPTDDDVGDLVKDKWAGDTRYFHGSWHRYHDGIWVRTESPIIWADIWEAMAEQKPNKFRPSATKARSIENYLQARLIVTQSELDKQLKLINLQNGVYNIDTRMLELHRREHFHTSQLPFSFDEHAKSPIWDQFLAQVLVDATGQTDPQLIKLIQEGFGYTLTPDMSFETAFWLWGLPASGKSTVTRVVQALLGDSCLSVNLGALHSHSYELALIPGKRALISTESKVGGHYDDDLFKRLISGETMPARQIYGQPFEFIPRATLIWAMNDQPSTADRSGAINRRLQIIPFRRTIPEAKRDRSLIVKLQRELPGIFNWALAGLQRLNEQGHFTVAEQARQAGAEYQAENDIEAAFLADVEWCQPGSDRCVQASTLYAAYKAWCIFNTHKPKTATAVAKDWERLGLTKFKDGCVFYRGIDLTDNAYKAADRMKANPR